ncbi:membrane anchored protein in chemotaxis locus [Shewanella litoralis]|uniref:Membrane anchored protein in chemotaxis locus n=1 Tax=Shewanella litoralis TaxID=2282700 RepID=A0ABQ2RDH7_9GAMM|nr:membrane anchored protein in chemotaxis locus [Shewanella litoralis]GGQ26442.1 membrane anchored protein in chemotaxis locus [Shewanella litoralis]
MANSATALITKLTLGIFLCFVAILVLGSLYVDSQRKMTLLSKEIEQLKASQVLLMVPEDQAENIANWLLTHPEQTQAMISKTGKDEAKSVLIGPGADASNHDKLSSPTDSSQTLPTQEVIVSENAQGVKVISLPNGGIRVTTREDKQQKQQ